MKPTSWQTERRRHQTETWAGGLVAEVECLVQTQHYLRAKASLNMASASRTFSWKSVPRRALKMRFSAKLESWKKLLKEDLHRTLQWEQEKSCLLKSIREKRQALQQRVNANAKLEGKTRCSRANTDWDRQETWKTFSVEIPQALQMNWTSSATLNPTIPIPPKGHWGKATRWCSG